MTDRELARRVARRLAIIRHEFQSAFHWHLLDRGIRHVCIKPATPRLNSKVDAPTASTTKSSTGCSRASSWTTASSSTPSSKSGSTSTISIARTQLLMAKRRTSAASEN